MDRTYTYNKQILSFKENFENFLQKGNISMSQIVCLGINKDNLLNNQIQGFNLINRLCQKLNKPLFLVGYSFAMNNVGLYKFSCQNYIFKIKMNHMCLLFLILW